MRYPVSAVAVVKPWIAFALTPILVNTLSLPPVLKSSTGLAPVPPSGSETVVT